MNSIKRNYGIGYQESREYGYGVGLFLSRLSSFFIIVLTEKARHFDDNNVILIIISPPISIGSSGIGKELGWMDFMTERTFLR